MNCYHERMLPPQQPGLVLLQTVAPTVGRWKVKARNTRNAHVNTCYPHIAFQSLMPGPTLLSCFFLLERSWVFPAASKARGLKLAPTVSSCCCLLQADLTALSSHCPLTLGIVLRVGRRPVDQTRCRHLTILFGPAHILCVFYYI